MRRFGTMAVLVALAALGATPGEAGAAEAESCLDTYLLCINDASQEEGGFWRTLQEVECGVGYYGCVKKKASGN